MRPRDSRNSLGAGALLGLWVFLVLVPGGLIGWMLHGLLEQERSEVVRNLGRALEQRSRRLILDSQPGQVAVRQLVRARRASVGRAAPTAVVLLPAHRDAREARQVVEQLREYLVRGQPLDTVSMLRMRHHLGWTFLPYLTREQPGIPEEIRWDGKPAWLVWKPSRTQGAVDLAVLAPPPRSRLLQRVCRAGTASLPPRWAVIDRSAGRWWGSPGAAEMVKETLRQVGRREQGTLVTEGRVRVFSVVEPATILLLETPLPSWTGRQAGRWLAVLLVFGFLSLTLFFPWICRRFLAFSLRWKLLGLTAYLVAIPLSLALLLGTGFLAARRQSLDRQNLAQAVTDLEWFDGEFLQHLRTVEIRLDRLCQWADAVGVGVASLSERVEPFFRTRTLDRFILLGRTGDMLLDRCSPRRVGALMNEVGNSFLRDSLERERSLPPKPATRRFQMFQELIRGSIWGSHYLVPGILQRFVHGTQIFYSFWKLLPVDHPLFGILAADLFHEDIMPSFLRRRPPGGFASRLLAWHARSRAWFPDPGRARPDLEALVDAVFRSGAPQTARVVFPEGPALVMALPAHHLRGCVLTAVIPGGKDDHRLLAWRRMLAVGLVLCGGLALACWSFLVQLLLVPVQGILEGITRLRRLETSVPIAVLGDDEISRLSQGINRMMTITDELDLARVVQRSFVPERPPELKRFRLEFWESRRLGVGGAFFDWYKHSENVTILLFGAAIGQGIGAALIMAMVKALAFIHFREGGSPERFLSRAREALPALGVTRACMSLTLTVVDEGESRIVFHSAGSPFVLVRSAGTPGSRYVGRPSAPLGTASPGPEVAADLCLTPGDAVLLFTAGVVRAIGPTGEAFGYDALAAAFDDRGDASTLLLENVRGAFQRHVAGQEQGKEALFLISRVPDPVEVRS